MNNATAEADPMIRAVAAAKRMFPAAEVKVRRGRVLAVEGDLIRWVRYENLDRPAPAKSV